MTSTMAGTRVSIGFLAGLVLAGLGCNNTKAQCEHGRDVAAKWQDQSAQRALNTVGDPNARAELEREAKRETEAFKAKFVEQCIAAPEATHACVARLEEFLAAEGERMAALDRCSSAPIEQRSACMDEASKASAAKVGDCKAPLEALFDATFAAAGMK